jgi:isopenicillin N synthase-like dioxygenase
MALRSVAEAYISHMENLGKAVIAAIAMALEIDATLLSSRIDRAFWQLRLIFYPGRRSSSAGQAGIGQHTGSLRSP